MGPRPLWAVSRGSGPFGPMQILLSEGAPLSGEAVFEFSSAWMVAHVASRLPGMARRGVAWRGHQERGGHAHYRSGRARGRGSGFNSRRDKCRLPPPGVTLDDRAFPHANAVDSVPVVVSVENTQCPLWFSGVVESTLSLGVDALAHCPWPPGLLYAFPPVCLIPRLLERIRVERRRVILVVPDIAFARWYPLLVSLALGAPWGVPDRPWVLSQAGGQVRSRPRFRGRLLMVWMTRGSDGSAVASPLR